MWNYREISFYFRPFRSLTFSAFSIILLYLGLCSQTIWRLQAVLGYAQFMWRYQTILANPRDSSRARVRLHCIAIWSTLCNKLCCAYCVHQKSENLNFWSKRKVVFVFTVVLDVQTKNCCKLASFPNQDEKRSQSSFFDVMHTLRSLNFNCC